MKLTMVEFVADSLAVEGCDRCEAIVKDQISILRLSLADRFLSREVTVLEVPVEGARLRLSHHHLRVTAYISKSAILALQCIRQTGLPWSLESDTKNPTPTIGMLLMEGKPFANLFSHGTLSKARAGISIENILKRQSVKAWFIGYRATSI